MKNRFSNFFSKRRLSIQTKIGGICIIANVMVFVLLMVLMLGINSMSENITQVYNKNLSLNELADSLNSVQESMTTYLSVKTSDSLEEYYRCEQEYRSLCNQLGDDVTDATHDRMERNIRNMSEEYLSLTSQTIEAKRGRNVEKYRIRYENATTMYSYINDYISSLNSEQLQSNSKNYVKLSKDFSFFEVVCQWIMLIVMVGNIIIIFKMTGTIISPLKKLAVSADEVAEGNFDVEFQDTASKDEIGTVTNAFNSMLRSIREYVETIKENAALEQAHKEQELKMEANLKEAELKYLQAQINPHFLFNTLNAGAQLAMMEDADRTYEYIQNMSEIFRYTVRKADEIVTIREELELVDHYVFVLNVRFSGEIHYEKDVDESALGVVMPSMIMQPIVENCVNHGIREMEGRGKIEISVYREGDDTCIRIKDNGIGMKQEVIDKILSGKWREESESRQGDSNGVGIDNVIERIRLYTDNPDAISIRSEGENMGTEVILRLRTKEVEEYV